MLHNVTATKYNLTATEILNHTWQEKYLNTTNDRDIYQLKFTAKIREFQMAFFDPEYIEKSDHKKEAGKCEDPKLETGQNKGTEKNNCEIRNKTYFEQVARRNHIQAEIKKLEKAIDYLTPLYQKGWFLSILVAVCVVLLIVGFLVANRRKD